MLMQRCSDVFARVFYIETLADLYKKPGMERRWIALRGFRRGPSA